MKIRQLVALTAAITLMAGCATAPQPVDALVDAREKVATVNNDPMAERVAGAELKQAKAALQRAEVHKANRDDIEDIHHDAYLAHKHAQVAEERIAEARARKAIDSSEEERNRVLLQAREVEARRAQELAAANAREADRAKMVAEVSRQDAILSAEQAEQERARAEIAIAESNALRQAVEDLKAEKTERGLVLTLTDMLFDTNKADLKPGANAAIERLAAFLDDDPNRHLLIEGHTDSRGDDDYNRDLSEKRAKAVRDALIDLDVDSSRLRAKGLGEEFPVATNESAAGRQENRRVEIVISDADGNFPDVAERLSMRQ